MNVQVAILLATYNGEKFIEKQLDSLLGQSFQQFKIYIHDDGSNDKTLEIIRSYESQFPGKFVIFEEESKHLGAAFSFMWLLNRVEAPYYMFCDQDDIWFPQKIELTLKKMKEIEYHYPMPLASAVSRMSNSGHFLSSSVAAATVSSASPSMMKAAMSMWSLTLQMVSSRVRPATCRV